MMRLLRALHARMHTHAEASDTGYEALAAGVAGVFLITLTLFGTPLWRTIAGGATHTAAVISAVLVDMANADRAALGLGTLVSDPLLTAAAQAKATDMAQKSYFAHFDASGKAPWDWMHEAGYRYAHAGENLAIQFSESGDVQRAWLASPSHRANLLDERFTQVGIATAEGFYQGQPTTFVVQFFAAPAGVIAESAPRAEPVSGASAELAAPAPTLAAEDSDVLVLGVQEETPEDATEVLPSAEAAALQVPPLPPVAASAREAFAAQVQARAAAPSPDVLARVSVYPWESVRAGAGMLAILLVLALCYLALREWRMQHERHALYAAGLSAACAVLFVALDGVLMQAPSVQTMQSAIASLSADAPARLSAAEGMLADPSARQIPADATLALIESGGEQHLASAAATRVPSSALAVLAGLAVLAYVALSAPRRRSHRERA